jgi:alpha-tubulin suppressor-like RCC1 family protein
MDQLPAELLPAILQHLDERQLLRLANTCKKFRYGDGGMETVELPTASPVAAVLLERERACAGGLLIPHERPAGCPDSWVAYLVSYARRRRCRETPPMTTKGKHRLFVDASGQLLECCSERGGGTESRDLSVVAALAGASVLSAAVSDGHACALTTDGRIYTWDNSHGELGHGDPLLDLDEESDDDSGDAVFYHPRNRPLPTAVEGPGNMRGVALGTTFTFVVLHSGQVFICGERLDVDFLFIDFSSVPLLVDGFGEVRVVRVCAGIDGNPLAFAIGDGGELFSWGTKETPSSSTCHHGCPGLVLGHGDHERAQPIPKRVAGLQHARVIAVSASFVHVLALTQHGLVHVWGPNKGDAVLGDPNVEFLPTPTPVEALRHICVSAIAAAGWRSYAVTDTGAVWAWGLGTDEETGSVFCPIGHGDEASHPLPRPTEALRGVRVDAVTGSWDDTLALADDVSVYAWGTKYAAWGALGLGSPGGEAGVAVLSPVRIPALLAVARGT